jgi:hypothetical protein
MSEGRGVGGNREVSPLVFPGLRGDLSGAQAEAYRKEGGSWGKRGFHHGSERQLATAQEQAVAAPRG